MNYLGEHASERDQYQYCFKMRLHNSSMAHIATLLRKAHSYPNARSADCGLIGYCLGQEDQSGSEGDGVG